MHITTICLQFWLIIIVSERNVYLVLKTVDDLLLPTLPLYWLHLQAAMKDTSYANAVIRSDAQKVFGALLVSDEFSAGHYCNLL